MMKRLLITLTAAVALVVVMGSGTCASGGYCTTTVVVASAPAYREHCDAGNKGNPINCVIVAKPDRFVLRGQQYDTDAGAWSSDHAGYTTIVLPADKDGNRLLLYVSNAAMSKPLCT